MWDCQVEFGINQILHVEKEARQCSIWTIAVCEVTFDFVFITTATKMLWKIVMLIWKLVKWVQETIKQL